jgi:hypothetical protein
VRDHVAPSLVAPKDLLADVGDDGGADPENDRVEVLADRECFCAHSAAVPLRLEIPTLVHQARAFFELREVWLRRPRG